MGANPIGRGERAEEAGVADFAQERRHGREDRLHGAVAAEDAPVLAAAALVVAAEEEKPQAVDAERLRDDRGLRVPLRPDHLLLRRMLLEAGAESRRFEVGVDVEDVGVFLELVRRQDRTKVCVRHVGQCAHEDGLCRIRRADREREGLEGSDIFPDRLGHHREVRLVPEAPGIVGVAEGRYGVRHECIERHEIGRELAAAGLLAAGVGGRPGEDAGRDEAVCAEVRGVVEPAPVCEDAGFGVHALPHHALARLRDAALAHEFADDAEGVAVVPRAVEGLGAMREGRIDGEGGVGVPAGVAAHHAEVERR